MIYVFECEIDDDEIPDFIIEIPADDDVLARKAAEKILGDKYYLRMIEIRKKPW